jgi:hypothetical protein
MRKLVVSNITSLDGYFEGPGKNVMVGAAVLPGRTPTFGTGAVPPLRLLNTGGRDGSDNLLVPTRWSAATTDSWRPGEFGALQAEDGLGFMAEGSG